jgi:3-oxoacyl-(acyl-carrier-protein) synthase
MITEILTYHHSLDWNIEQFVDSTGLANIVQPHWSMVTSTRSGLVSTDSVGKDLFELKKKRGRPTELRNSTTDSLGSFVANKLHLNGFVTNVSAECSGSIHALYTASTISLSQQQPVIVFCADNLVDDAMQMWRFSSMGALDQSSGRAFDSTSA